MNLFSKFQIAHAVMIVCENAESWLKYHGNVGPEAELMHHTLTLTKFARSQLPRLDKLDNRRRTGPILFLGGPKNNTIIDVAEWYSVIQFPERICEPSLVELTSFDALDSCMRIIAYQLEKYVRRNGEEFFVYEFIR